MTIQQITDEEFSTVVLGSKGYVMVEFWSPTCSSCAKFVPMLEQIAEHYKDKMTVVAMDTSIHKTWLDDFDVVGLPCCVMFKDGVDVGTHEGASVRIEYFMNYFLNRFFPRHPLYEYKTKE